MTRATLPAAFALALAGCSSDPAPAGASGDAGDAATPGREIRAGAGVGEVRLGARLQELPASVGEPAQTLVNQRLGFVRYAGGLELVITSPAASEAAPTSLVVAIGVSQAEGYLGIPRVGQPRQDVEAALGAPADEIEAIAYYARGASVTYADGVAARVAVFDAYENHPAPPEMEAAP